MANSNVSDWDEIEADPEFSSFPRETQLGLFNDWEKKFNRTLLEDADLDKVKPEGLNRFAATNAIRRRKLSGEDVSDPNTAVKSWSEQKQAEAKLAQQTLKDYADVEDKKFRLDDARSMPGVDEFGRASPEWDKGVQEASKSLEAAEAKLAPEVRAQAQAASEALKGKRKIATLNGNIYTDPALVLNKEEFRQQVLDSDASPEAKALKLASFQSERKRFANEALRTLRVVGESPIPGAQDFPSWEASQPKEVYRLPPEDKALQYLREMQKRGDIRKLTSAIGTGILQGGVDIATQAVGTAAMLTGDEETSKVAAELSRASGDIGAAQGLEGDMQATGGTFAGGLSRLGTNMAPMLLPGGAVGGIARMAGAGAGAATAAAVGASALTAGAQTAGSQFGEVYDHLRQQGSTHEQAFGVSRNAAILSGAVTTALTALGGATGVESMLRQGGKELVKSRLKAALKAVPGGAAAEIAEELPDEYVSQLVSAFAKDPTASVSQVTDEFAANAPDLILQIAALGGAGSGVGRFKETTTDPTKAGQPAPADDFAQRAAMEGATEYRAPEEAAARADMRSAAEEEVKKGIPVEVEGVVIATINPESGWTPEDVLDFANSPEDMATLARNKIITLPEVVAPIEGVDLAITEEMNARLAAGKAAGSAGQTLAELERQKAETEALKAEAREAGVNIDLPPDEAFEEVLRAREKASRDAEIRLEQMKAQEEEAAARETGTRRQAAETLGVRPPQEVDISEGAARNADIIRQARARMAGTEQGPRIGFLQSPAVTTATETPSSTANAAGGRQGVQTEPAEGSIPAVTEDIVSTSDTPSTPVSPQGEAPTTATEGQPMPGGSSEWSPTPGQPATANINGQKVVGTVGPSTGKGLVSFQYEWNGKPQKATVRPDRLSSPVASLTDPPRYQYTQEQNTRKMAKHFPSAPGVHANHDFRKSFASMAKDKSLNRIYQKIAEVLSKMPAFANVDLHVVADENQAYAGEYSFDNGKASIGVNLRQVGRGRVDALGTLLHEALHHVTLAKVRDPQGTWENEVLDKLDTIRGKVLEFAKSQGLDQRLDYELGTVEEFITAVFTRPDFQNFLASIPDSFSTGVGVGKFRSVLSEVFRLITEFLSGEPVARGSTMEQSMTTILAMFETPFRAVETGKLEALNAVQSPAGYRTPTDMLAEAAQRAKGEAVGTKPQRLASMFKPQAKRPATGERKLLDMPTRSVLTDAYREAVRGSSTQMAPLSTVYAQARLLQPGLTPETFLAQVQEGYDNGTLLLEGAGSQQEAAQSSLSLPGTPVGTAVRMMPAPQGTLKSKADDMDAEYMAAVESGDVAKQQAMVNAAAKAAVQPFSTETKRTGFTNHTKVRLGSREVSVFRDPENGYWYFADKGGLGDVIAMGKQAAIKAAIERLEEESGGAQPSTEVLFRDWRKDTTITLPGFYLRFGDLPKGGKSVKGHEPGLYEKGVSVLKAWRSPDGVYVISSVGAETGASDMVAGMEGRSIYIAYGEDTGEVGSDGEPLLKNVVLTELVMNNRVVVDDPSYIDQPITNNISEAKEWETISPAPDPLAAADPVTRDKQGNVIPPPQRFNPKSNSTLYSKADDGEPPIIDIGGEAEPADGKGKQLYQKNPTAIGDTYISPADITLQEKKTQQETLDAARKIIGEEIAKNPNNTLAGRRAALNRFRLDTSIPPEVRAVGTGVIAQQADRMANLSEGTDQLLLDEMADEAAKLSGIMSSDLEAWRNLKADANLQIDKMAEEAGRTLNIFNVFRRLTPEGFLRRMTRKFNDAVREKVGQNFDVPAGEVEREIRKKLLLLRGGPSGRAKRHAKKITDALRNQKIAEKAIERIQDKLAGPQPEKGAINPVSELIGEHLSKEVPDFVEKVKALEVPEDVAKALNEVIAKMRSEVAALEKANSAEKAIKDLMKSLKPKPRAPREKIEKALKTLFTADTVGALDDQAFFDAFGEAFGMPPLSDEQQTRIKKLIREINSIPKGPARLDKQQDLDEELALWKGIAARDVLLSAWYANILSGFSTQGMGLLGNAFNFVPRSLFLMATNPRSAKAYLKGAFGEGLSTGLKEAAAAMKGRGLYKVSKHGDKSIIGALELLRKKGPSTLSEWIAYISSAGTEMRRVFRIMQAIDALAWNTAREGHAYLAAHRALLEQEKESGTKRSPEEFSRAFIDSLGGDVAQIEEDLRAARQALIDAGQVPSILTVDRMAREARNLRRAASGVKASNRFADRIVLQLDPEGSGKFISSLIDVFQKKRILGLPVGQLLIPFNRIVSNLFEQSLDYTPVGLVRAILGGHLSDAEIGWDGVKFKEGSQLFDQMERRERGMAAVTGMAAAAAIYALANAYKDEPDEDVPFMVYGWGPESKNKRAQMPKGWVPYSVKWGDTYIKFSEMPFGMMFAAAGSAMDAMRYKGMDKKTSTQRLAYILKTAAKGFLNQGVMSSLDTALETLMFDASEKKMADIPVNVVKGLMPAQGMLRDISTIMDPTKVSDGSLTSMLLRDIPFAKSWGTKPDLNVFGEPIKLDGYPITRRIVTHREPHAVADYLGRNELSIPGMEQTIEIGKYLPDKAKDRIQARAVELGAMENGLFTPEQNYAFKKRAGELTKAAVQEIMKKTPKVANDEQRKQVQDNINKAVGIARNRAMLEAVPVK